MISSPFVGATCFEKADLQLECEPEAPDYVARRPRGLKQPGEPTLTERLVVRSLCACQEQAGQEPLTFLEAACAANGL